MKKICLFIIFVLCSLFTFSQNIEGKWLFESIRYEVDSTGKDLKPIADGDFMLINEDGTFEYALSAVPLKANGNWTLNKFALSFNYTEPKDTIRNYSTTLTKTHLILSENGVNFSFQRAVVVPTATSGFSISSLFRGILGIISLLLIAFLFSRNRKGIDWALVSKGLGIQILFALLILKVPIVSSGFEFVGKIFTKIISFTQDGTMFLFKSFETGIIESPLMNFVVMILPTVIFFSALTSLFYYWGIIPRIVYGFAWLMKKIMRLSGPESVAAAGNIFLGQTESPLLVKPYLDKMTMSEMLCLMSGGMATIAGGVLAAYIGFLGGDDPVQQIMFAKHLLAASVMSAPAAIVAAKILLPENQAISGGLAGLASQFGMNLSQGGGNVDLSSPSLFPELIKSRTFSERILKKSFYTDLYNKELSLLAILTHGKGPPNVGMDTLIQNAMGAFQNMVSFKNEGSANIVISNSTLIIPLSGLINTISEIKKLSQKKDKELIDLQKIVNKLENKKFMEKAPEQVIEQFKNQEQEIKSSIEKIEQIINTIK